MVERNFNVAHNEELTPSVQPVKTFSGASHKTLAHYVNDTESTMTQSLDVSIACQRFQLAGIIVLADGENFSSTNLTATAYKNHENRKYQLATETISLPATNAGNMGYVAAIMSGYEDFVDSISFSGTISIAAGGSVTIIALFKGGEDSALATIAENTKNSTNVQTVIIADTDAEIEAANNTIYSCGVLDSLEISIPAQIPLNYISQINFSSGATPTTFSTTSTISFVGDDVSGGTFTPAASTRYIMIIHYDGVNVVCNVQGI